MHTKPTNPDTGNWRGSETYCSEFTI